ncbi:hypothetical protein FQN57_002895 [Myotisia sp. PD_48]|nr:hypothetical protein FQN57_002895 [Myotisia sp. PD_48]
MAPHQVNCDFNAPGDGALLNVRKRQELQAKGRQPKRITADQQEPEQKPCRRSARLSNKRISTSIPLRAILKPEGSLRRKGSSSSSSLGSTATSDQNSREGKSAKYKSLNYLTVLALKGSFMAPSDLGVTDASKNLCKRLLYEGQPTPHDTLFHFNRFQKACENLEDKNEPRVIQDIARLIVPSAESLAIYDTPHLRVLIESVNESWRSSLAFCGPLPQPDYSVAFKRSTFTDSQLEKLTPFIGKVPGDYSSYFLGTFKMYFPFLSCEAKCGTSGLEIADRQNAHSMTIAVRAIVELFKWLGRGEEVNREILAFSISHDNKNVRIYGHYAVIEGEKVSFYRHHIHSFDFTALDGRSKWTAYQFIRNVYDIWMPDHLDRIRSAIDQILLG